MDDTDFVANLTSHQGMLLSYLNTILPGEPEVQDIAQRASIVLWKKRAEFKPGTSFKSWALSIAYWEARAWMSARKRKGWLIFDEDLVQAVTNRFTEQEELPECGNGDSIDALRQCLAKLRESDRLIVVNHYQHDKSLAECSRILGRNREALKKALFRLRAVLRRCIKAQLALDHLRS